jgi:hypothetical protein
MEVIIRGLTAGTQQSQYITDENNSKVTKDKS